jgi:hypothetical protein
MLCIEAGNVNGSKLVTLAPQSAWTGSQTLTLIAEGKSSKSNL